MASSNNINKRLANSKSAISNSLSSKQINNKSKTVLDKLTGFTSTFTDAFKSNNKEPANNKSRTGTNANVDLATGYGKEDNPFDNPMLLATLVIITLAFAGYGIYKYYNTGNQVQPGKSFYGENILTYEPLFRINSEKIEPCIKQCERDSLCSGVTFNQTEQTCVGTKRGVLRSDEPDISSWVKPADYSKVTDILAQVNSPLAGYVSSYMVIKSDQLSFPGNPYQFNWSMYMYINDFYENHGTWRHIMHKGTEPDSRQLDTPNWEDILADFPDQSIGIWMAPYNNNIRIALTTLTTNYIDQAPLPAPHAMAQNQNMPGSGSGRRVAGYAKNVEFLDIPHFPNKKLVHLSVNVLDNSLEVYKDGLLYKTFHLVGRPEFNKGGNLYMLKPKTLDGSLFNVTYNPRYLGIAGIKKLMADADKLKSQIIGN
jgi:hypothetical protein